MQSDLGLHCLHVILSETGVQNFRAFNIILIGNYMLLCINKVKEHN